MELFWKDAGKITINVVHGLQEEDEEDEEEEVEKKEEGDVEDVQNGGLKWLEKCVSISAWWKN